MKQKFQLPANLLRTCQALTLLLTALLISGRADAAVALDQVAYVGYSTDYVVMSGTTAFVTVGDELQAITVSDPNSPSVIGRCSLLDANLATVGKVVGLELSGTTVYVLRDNGEVALQIVDVGTPTAPVLRGSYSPPVSSEIALTGRSLSVQGTFAYLGIPNYGVIVVDASNPSSPVFSGAFEISPGANVTTPSVLDISASGSRVFVLTTSPAAVYSIDFSIPGSPVLLGGNNAPAGNPQKILATATNIFLYDSSVQILDATVPAILPSLSSGSFSAKALQVFGTTAYGANSVQLQAVNISNPAAPSVLGFLSLTGASQVTKGDLAVSSGLALLATGADLRSVDVSLPASPTLLATYASHFDGEPLRAPVFAGGIMYVLSDASPFAGAGKTALSALQLVNGGSPLTLGSLILSAADFPHDIAASGNAVYLVTESDFIVVDATVPQNLAIAGRHAHPGGLRFGDTVAANGTRVYTGGADGVNIYDASTPSSILVLGQYVGNFPNIVGVSDLKVSGTQVFCAAGTNGVQILNASNPSVPLLLSVGNAGGATIGEVQIAGSRCYARSSDKLIVLNVSVPSAPSILGQLTLPASATLKECFACGESLGDTFVVSGTTGYVAGGEDGLLLVDFSRVATPAIADYWDTWWLNYVALDNNLLYLAEDAYEFQNPGETGLRIANPPILHIDNGNLGGYISADPFFPEEGSKLTLTAPEGTNFQWYKYNVALTDQAPGFTGTNTRTLVFNPVYMSDQGVYTVQYDDGAKQLVESQPFFLVVHPSGSLPVAGAWSLGIGALALMGWGSMKARTRRKQ